MHASQFLSQLKNLSKEELLEIKGIGDVLAQNYLDFVNSNRYYKLIQEFAQIENTTPDSSVNIVISNRTQAENVNLPLSQETICITGTFDIPRPEIKTQLEQLGAKVTDSVTSNTTILLAGNKAGSKLEKAQKLNIRIVDNLSILVDLD